MTDGSPRCRHCKRQYPSNNTSSFPRKRESGAAARKTNLLFSCGNAALDSRFRGNDEVLSEGYCRPLCRLFGAPTVVARSLRFPRTLFRRRRASPAPPIAVSLPAPIAMPTSAGAGTGASLTPSPAMAPRRVGCGRSRERPVSSHAPARGAGAGWRQPAAAPLSFGAGVRSVTGHGLPHGRPHRLREFDLADRGPAARALQAAAI